MKTVGTILLLTVLLAGVSACGVAPTPVPPAPPPPPGGEGFAIYLLAAPLSPADAQRADLDSLILADKPLIAAADMVRYQRATHTMQLTPSGYAKVKALPFTISGPPFVACVDRHAIYSGSFWTSLSSASFSGIVIDTLRPGGDTQTLHIQLAYPESPEMFVGEDKRADPRILQALAAAGKLE